MLIHHLRSRLRPAGLAAAIAIYGIVGCGGDGEPSASKAQVAASDVAPAVTVPAPAATTASTTPSATATERGGEPARTGRATTPGDEPATTGREARQPAAAKRSPSTGERSPAQKGTPPPPAAPQKSTPPPPAAPQKSTPPPPPAAPGSSPPPPPAEPETTGASEPAGPALECLGSAGLENPTKLRDGLWRARARDGSDIVVDGPYESAAAARESAASLEGVTRAQAGGTYMVSAPLAADVGSEVTAVANCLRDKSS